MDVRVASSLETRFLCLCMHNLPLNNTQMYTKCRIWSAEFKKYSTNKSGCYCRKLISQYLKLFVSTIRRYFFRLKHFIVSHLKNFKYTAKCFNFRMRTACIVRNFLLVVQFMSIKCVWAIQSANEVFSVWYSVWFVNVPINKCVHRMKIYKRKCSTQCICVCSRHCVCVSLCMPKI